MTFYVAVIALLNLGLGYALAVYLGAGRAQAAAMGSDSLDDVLSEHVDGDA